MRVLRLLVPVCLATSVPEAWASSESMSWGKADVSLEEYVHDAQQCSDSTRAITVAIKPETLRALDALSIGALLDIAMQATPSPTFNPMSLVDDLGSQKSVENVARRTNTFGAKYEQTVRGDVKDQLQYILDKCLYEHGYVPIRLTDRQKRGLGRLKRKSIERTRYLYSIDSNRTVIDNQTIKENDK